MQSTILSLLLSQTSTVGVPDLLRYTNLSTTIRDTQASPLSDLCWLQGTHRHTQTHTAVTLLLLRVKLLGFGTSVQNRHRMINKSHMADAHWRMKFGLVSMDLQTS